MRDKPLGCVPLDAYSQLAPVILFIIVEAMEDPKTKRDYEKWACVIKTPLLDAVGVFPETYSKKAIFAAFCYRFLIAFFSLMNSGTLGDQGKSSSGGTRSTLDSAHVR